MNYPKNIRSLAQMGFGVEVLNALIDTSNVRAAIENCKDRLKYVKTGVKSGLLTHERGCEHLHNYYNQLLAVEYCVHHIMKEDFYKIKLEVEKFLNHH